MYLHRIALTVFAALALTGTAQAADTFVHDGGQVIVYPVEQPRGRVILLHGFGDTAATFAAQNDALIAGLMADRWQVVTPDLPFAGNVPTSLYGLFAQDRTGASYMPLWVDRFEAVAAELDRRYGTLPLVIGGISWGGFNALTAACHSGREVGWFVQAPVVDPSRLAELAGWAPLAGMQLATCAPALRATDGLISHNLLDTRVGVEPTRALADALAGPRFTEQVFPDLAHVTTAATNDGLLAWVRTLLPTAPAPVPTPAPAPVVVPAPAPAPVVVPEPQPVVEPVAVPHTVAAVSRFATIRAVLLATGGLEPIEATRIANAILG